jgi:hypothetical protein
MATTKLIVVSLMFIPLLVFSAALTLVAVCFFVGLFMIEDGQDPFTRTLKMYMEFVRSV